MEEGRGKRGEKAPGKKSSPSPPLPLAFPLLLSLSPSLATSIHRPSLPRRPRPPAARLPDRRRARPAFPFVGRVLKEVQIQFVSRADGWTDGQTGGLRPHRSTRCGYIINLRPPEWREGSKAEGKESAGVIRPLTNNEGLRTMFSHWAPRVPNNLGRRDQ